MSEFRHTRLISEYDSVTGKFINYLELGDTSTDPDTPVDLRFRVPGYIENVHTIYFEGDHGDSPEAGISTSKPSGIVHDLVFFDPQNTSGKTLSELAAGGGEGVYLPLSAGSTKPLTGDLYMGGKDIIEIKDLHGRPGNWDFEFYGGTGTDSVTEIMRWDASEQNLSMAGNKIANLGIGAASSNDAARMFNLDSYMLTATYVGGDGVIDIPVGGTGISAFAKGDILYASDVNTLAALVKGTATQVLTMNAAGTLPEWAASGSGGTGLWQDTGTYAELIAAEDITIQSKNITGVNGITMDSEKDGINMSDSPISNAGGITMSDAINMGGSGIIGASVIKAAHIAGVEFRPYDYVAEGDELLDVAWNGYAFVAGADASMGNKDIFNVKTISGTTSIPLHLDFCGDATHEIWREGDDLKFKDATATGTKTLSQLAAGGGSSTFTGLSDTPPNYTDHAGEFVKVKSDLSGLEFVAGSGSFICTDLNSCHVTDLTDVSSAGSHSIITDAERNKLNGIDTSLYMLLSVYDPGSDGVVIPTAGGTGLGSGLNAYETGDILYASAANILGRLVHGEENQVLTMNSSLLPVWETPSGGTGLWESPADETYLTTPEPVNLKGESLKDMGSRYGKHNTLQQWYYDSAGGGVVKMMELNSVAMNMLCPLNMNGSLIDDVDTVKANDTLGVKFKQSNTDDIRLYAAWAGYAFVANANANMNTHNIINVSEIKGTTNQDIYVKPLGSGILYLG